MSGIGLLSPNLLVRTSAPGSRSSSPCLWRGNGFDEKGDLNGYPTARRLEMDALLLTNPSVYGSRVPLTANSRKSRGCRRVSTVPRCTMEATFGGNFVNLPKFPRMNIWDPYKRLGVARDASEEEIRGARNFLLQEYAGDESSFESIEAAYEKILMASFRLRKKSKFNLKTSLKRKVEESPSWVKSLLECVELPPTDVILRRLFLFAFMGAWSVMNSAEAGPAFQVAMSLAACVYFLNDKTKSLTKASILGFGALVIGWVCGSIVVPMVPSVLLQPTWTLELLTSLVVYVFLFLACTFLK